MKPDRLTKLLRAGRLKWVGVRAIEWSARGAMVGVGAAAIVVAAQWWLNEWSGQLAAVTIGVGAAAGAVLSLAKIPSQQSVAERIDQQFRLHDLLSTALALSRQPSADADMASAILHQANAAAKNIPATTIQFAKVHPRTYGIAVISTGVVLTLSAIAKTNQPSQASIASATSSRREIQHQPEQGIALVRRNQSNSVSADQATESAEVTPSPPERSARQASGAASNAHQTTDSNSTGAGSAGADSASAISSSPTPTVTTQTSSRDGQTGSGGPANQSGEWQGEGVVAGNTTVANSTISERTASDSPGHPKQNGRSVPAAYRDLVKAYFSRDK